MWGRRPYFLVLLPTVFLANPLSAQTTWTIPGTANASGQNNTRFVSDLTATNPGTSAVDVAISFFPASSPNTKNVTLNAGETIVYRNVVESLFGATGAGALSISSGQPLLLRARTYNTASSGTYGVALPVYEAERFLTAGEVGDTVWVSQDAAASSGYRTNIAVVFPDETGGAATVTVYDADGNERGHRDYALDTAGFQQFAAGSFAGAVSVGRAQVHVTRGRAAGYSVVVDNVTGDSSLFTFEDLPGGRQDVLINGVARANGRNGTFFRTDGRFHNPTDSDATIQVSFHASGNSNPSPATGSFTLPAGKIRDVVDVLDTLLGLPVGSSGALRFQSDWPIGILCRTSNVDPSGARPGTFGAQQKPVQILSFLTSADAGASITGIRQDASYRTNVGFAAGEDGARYTLTLTTAGGATVATASSSLGPWGWTQPNVQDLFPGTSIPSDATLKVKVTEGSLDVYDSSIDNLSGDSVVTPIAPLPVAIPTSAAIGPAGGSIRSDDGRLTLRVPAGALTSSVALSFQTTSNSAPQGTGPGYQLSPSGLTFAKPALLTLAYGRSDTDGSSAEALAIATRSGAAWLVLAGGTVDSGRHLLTVPLSETSAAAAAPPGSRRAAADAEGNMAVAQAWQFSPTGRRAVPTGGRLNFSVYVVGAPSSRSVIEILTRELSRDPAEVQAEWFVERVHNGDAVNGLILHEGAGGTVSVKYQAPGCVPPENPVIIQATIQNRLGSWQQVYEVSGYAVVRVLPRNWTFKSTMEQVFGCPNSFAADDVRYTAGFTFSLDDNTNVINPAATVTIREYIGSPTACDRFNVDLTRKGDPQMTATLNGGNFDAELDAFRLNVDWVFPTALGYNYTLIGTDGTRFPGKTFGPGPSVPVPGIEMFLNEETSQHSFPIPTTLFTIWEWTLKRAQEGGCP